VRLAWAPSFIESARRHRDSFICGVCSFLVEGTLEERGRKLVGTCWS
jgi:hypothetical protein